MSRQSAISQRAAACLPSVTLAITAAAQKLKAEGKDVLSFAAGEPDFKTPAHICEAAIKAIHDGLHGYTPNPGMPALKKAVADKFKRENNLDYTPEQVLVSPGAKYSLYLAIMAMIDPGDEVIVPTPAWVSYPPMVELAGGVPVLMPTFEKNAFSFGAAELRAVITPRTKAIILNSPSNPTGGIVPEKDLKAIAAVCEEKGLWVISDEIYEHLIYGADKHVSIASLSDYMLKHTVVINGVSKAYAMTGWRIGYAAGPKDVISAMANIQSQSTSNACSIAQAASIAALNGSQECVETMRKAFEKRRDLIVKELNAIPGVRCLSPQGAFYAFPNVSALLGKTYGGVKVTTDLEFCNELLSQKLVACVAGGPFGGEGHIRLSYACSEDTIRKGVERLRQFVTQ